MTSCFVGLDKRKGVSTAKLLVEEAAGTDGPEFQKLVSEFDRCHCRSRQEPFLQYRLHKLSHGDTIAQDPRP